MNRYGDTPLGMVESALEFVRICEASGYRDLVISMKSSNPVVTIEAYRLLAARMASEGMDYPFHLGVTEAGDGEDGRIKSAIGIGALLDDGIGDTVRVSLTEDPVEEVPVARRLVERYNRLLAGSGTGAGARVEMQASSGAGAAAAEGAAATEGAGAVAAAGTAAAAGASAGERARTSPGRGASSIDETDSRRPEPGVTGGFSPPLSFDPFSHARRVSRRVAFGPCAIGGEEVVAVEVRLASPLEEESAIRREIDAQAGPRVPAETRADLVEACLDSEDDLERVGSIRSTIRLVAPCLALSARPSAPLAASLVRSLGGTTGDSAPEGTAQDLSSSNPPEAGVSSPAWHGPSSMGRSRAGTSSTPLLGRLDRCVLPARPLLDLLRGRAIDPLDLPVLTGCPLLIEGNADELLDLLGL